MTAGTSSARDSLRRCVVAKADCGTGADGNGPGGGIDSRGGNLRCTGGRRGSSTSSSGTPLADARCGRGGAAAWSDSVGDDRARASRSLSSPNAMTGGPDASPPVPRDDEGRDPGRDGTLRLFGRNELNVHVDRGEFFAGEGGVGSRGMDMGEGTGGTAAASEPLRPVNVRIIAAPNERVRGRVVATGGEDGLGRTATGAGKGVRSSNEGLRDTRSGSVGGQYGISLCALARETDLRRDASCWRCRSTESSSRRK